MNRQERPNGNGERDDQDDLAHRNLPPQPPSGRQPSALPAVSVVHAGEEDVAALATVLARAFHSDPVSQWLFPDATDRAQLHASFFQTFLDLALADGEVHTTPQRDAVALWLDVDPLQAGADDEATELLATACRADSRRFLVLDQLRRVMEDVATWLTRRVRRRFYWSPAPAGAWAWTSRRAPCQPAMRWSPPAVTRRRPPRRSVSPTTRRRSSWT